MIPIRDAVRSSQFPIVNVLIIGVNIIAFVWQMMQGPRLEEAFLFYGIVPIRYSSPEVAAHFTGFEQVLPFFTSMFLHGGFLHILGNMWFLYIFGDNIEDTIGHIRYLLFYLLCGLAAGLIHLYMNWDSKIPTIGASGAIAGVMGAYFILFPRSRVLTLIPILFIPYFIEIPAFFFLGMWFVMQFLNAAGSGGSAGGVAWWAHIGGFVFGMLLLKVFDGFPGTGLSDPLRRIAARTTTDRLQLIRPAGRGDSADLYATVIVSGHEARIGARKLVSVPGGFRKRLLRVLVPPGVRSGTLLRLGGMGNLLPDGQRGDLYLEVAIEE
jgi:hypothetical protein